MNKIKCPLSWIILLIAAGYNLSGQTAKHLMLEAQVEYDAGNFALAEQKYNRSFNEKPGAEAAYNLGNALYKQEKFDFAAGAFEDAFRLSSDPIIQSKAAFNLGNALLQSDQLEEAIEAFKVAVKHNPKDAQAKHNLLKSKEMLKEQQQQQQQQQQDQQQQQQQDQGSENEEQDQQQNTTAGEQEEMNQQEDQMDEGEQKEQGPERTPEQPNTTESLDQLLKIMEEEEKKVQQKLRKQQARPNRSTKRW